MAWYLDTSAVVKLVLNEAESPALRQWCQDWEGQLVTSDLTRTELLRAVLRGAPHQVVRCRAVLGALVMLRLDSRHYERAGHLAPPALRSLDAIHLAAAEDLGDDLDGFVTYDERLADAARAHGLPTLAPGTAQS